MDSQTILTQALIGQRIPELSRHRLRFSPAASDGAAVIQGNRALVTRLYHPGGRYVALRVAMDRDDGADWSRHYAALAEAMPESLAEVFPRDITVLDSGITIAGAKVPALLMEWIDGPTLFAAAHHAAAERNTDVLLAMAEAVRELSSALRAARVTHGDLAPDNLMMRSSGDLVCVDLDSLQWPGMRVRSRQDGSPAYRHPGHGAIPRHQDAYAALVLYTSLNLLADAPELREMVGHDVAVHGGGLLFSSWDLADPSTSRAFALARERGSHRSRRLLDILIKASEGEPYRVPELLEDAFSAPATREGGPDGERAQDGEWDLRQVIERLRSEIGESGEAASANPQRAFSTTWPGIEDADRVVPDWPGMEVEPSDQERKAGRSALEIEDELTASYQQRILEAVAGDDDDAIVRYGSEVERRQLPLDAESRKHVRDARERRSIRTRLERALRERDRSTLAELAHSGELAVLGDTDRASLTLVLQALEWPALVRAIETDDDALILNWFDAELFEPEESLPPELRARIDLAETRLEWVERIRSVLRQRDGRSLEELLANEPEGGLDRLSVGEKARVLRLIERRQALMELHAALREGDNAWIVKALGEVDRVGARIENPATWKAVQGVLERATIIEQIVDAAQADPPDDRQLAHLLPVAKTMGLSHDAVFRGDMSFSRLEAVVLRGAAARRIRQAIASGNDVAIRRAAHPDITGALALLTDEERERVAAALADRPVSQAMSR